MKTSFSKKEVAHNNGMQQVQQAMAPIPEEQYADTDIPFWATPYGQPHRPQRGILSEGQIMMQILEQMIMGIFISAFLIATFIYCYAIIRGDK